MSYPGKNFGVEFREPAPLERIVSIYDDWVFTAAENTTGINIYVLRCVTAQNGLHNYSMRTADSSTNVRFGYKFDAGSEVHNIFIPAGLGVYVTGNSGNNETYVAYDWA